MSSAVRIIGTTAAATAAATAVKVGDFGIGDALAVARDMRRGPVVLTLDLTRPLRRAETGLGALRTRGRPTVRDVLDALEAAAVDDRVVGLVARVGNPRGGLATTQELADAVRVFTATGKLSVAHSEAFGEDVANSTLAYLLATAFGEIHLQPTGLANIIGVSSEVTFLRGAFDKAGIEPQFGHRHEYKNAADPLTEHDFTDAHREALEALVDDWATQITDGIAAARGLDPQAVRAAMDTAPLTAQEALDRGLVDRLAYRDETVADVRSRAGDGVTLLPLPDYVASGRAWQRWRNRRGPIVALINAHGAITQARTSGPLSGPTAAADALSAALRRAAADDDIAAVLLHVDSPGGSAVASDAIRRAVITTREAGTPVIAWMGDMAASGGYYIAMAADAIVAAPGTLTGSIGVVAGKVVTSELEDRLGLRTRAVSAGDNARFYARSTAWDEQQRARLDTLLDAIYDDFTARVAHDRGMSRERVHELARGRIWTGAQAHARGLVDRLGGYTEAREAVRAALGLATGTPLRVHSWPPSPSLADRMRGREIDDPAEKELTAVLSALGGEPDALLDLVGRTLRPAGMLTMPFVPRLR